MRSVEETRKNYTEQAEREHEAQAKSSLMLDLARHYT